MLCNVVQCCAMLCNFVQCCAMLCKTGSKNQLFFENKTCEIHCKHIVCSVFHEQNLKMCCAMLCKIVCKIPVQKTNTNPTKMKQGPRKTQQNLNKVVECYVVLVCIFRFLGYTDAKTNTIK